MFSGVNPIALGVSMFVIAAVVMALGANFIATAPDRCFYRHVAVGLLLIALGLAAALFGIFNALNN